MEAVTIEITIMQSFLAQRGFDFGDLGEIIIIAVVIFGGLIAKGLKKIIEAINDKNGAGSPQDHLDRSGPASRTPAPPLARPIPPRIRRSPSASSPQPRTGQPVIRTVPLRPPTAAPSSPQGKPVAPVLFDENRPRQKVKRQVSTAKATKPGALAESLRKLQDVPSVSRDELDHLHPEKDLPHLDPEAHLGHQSRPAESVETATQTHVRRSRTKTTLVAALTGTGLRRAILLSEILNPPLALRDDTLHGPWAG